MRGKRRGRNRGPGRGGGRTRGWAPATLPLFSLLSGQLSHSFTELSEPWALGPSNCGPWRSPALCLCVRLTEVCATPTVCRWQSLKYFLSGPVGEKFATPCSPRADRFLSPAASRRVQWFCAAGEFISQTSDCFLVLIGD